MYLVNGIQEKLQEAFLAEGIAIHVKLDHVIVDNSQKQTEEKIRRIITSASFFPIISKKRIDGNFAFTLLPYKTPDFFFKVTDPEESKLESPPYESKLESPLVHAERDKPPYFNKDEISQLLKHKAFKESKGEFSSPFDAWSRSNNFRSYVSPALNKGLSEIITKSAKGEVEPIVELGSGIGYAFPEILSSQIIRIQPRLPECQLLSRSISSPIYQVNIEDFSKILSVKAKKIPLFFCFKRF